MHSSRLFLLLCSALLLVVLTLAKPQQQQQQQHQRRQLDSIGKQAKAKCKPNQFLCKRGGRCVDLLLTCDGNNDCADGSDEKHNCTDSCLINGTLSVDSGVTTQDDDWWYHCSRSRWRAAGCVIGGRRYAVGQTFTGFQNDFWGKCEKLGSNFLRRRLYGCVDYQGNLVKPGESYLIDPLFWATCTAYNTTSEIVGLGNVALTGVRRQVIGCNDGSEQPVPNNEEFLEIGDEDNRLGVALQCRLSSDDDWPQVVPVACVIGNETNPNEYIGLSNGCYETFGPIVYFCSINGKIDVNRLEDNRLNGTWRYNWQLSWNTTKTETIRFLESKGFLRCPSDPDDPPAQAAKQKLNNALSKAGKSRRRRTLPHQTVTFEDSTVGDSYIPMIRDALSFVSSL